MKCHVIDDHCQPLFSAAEQRRRALMHDLAELATRLFRFRFQRARLFERALREQARMENS